MLSSFQEDTPTVQVGLQAANSNVLLACDLHLALIVEAPALLERDNRFS